MPSWREKQQAYEGEGGEKVKMYIFYLWVTHVTNAISHFSNRSCKIVPIMKGRRPKYRLLNKFLTSSMRVINRQHNKNYICAIYNFQTQAP